MADQQSFAWGTGASSTDAEGIAPGTEAASWVAEGRLRPNGSGAALATRADDDLALLARHHLRSLRLTIEWARLEPHPGTLDTSEVERYRRILTAAADVGIEVWACLHDGTLPGWFSHDERGFRDQRSRRYHWARHVEVVGEHFGDLVTGWIPIQEPTRYAHQGWLDGTRPPGERDDAEGYAAAVEATHLASVEAALRLRGGGRPVASAQWMVPSFPARPAPNAPADAAAEAACSIVDDVLWGTWARMIDEETLAVPGRAAVDVPGAREAFDVLGITYRHAVAVRGDGALLPYPQALTAGSDGHVAWSEGLAIALHRVADRFPDRPIMIVGAGVRTGDEGQRTDTARDLVSIVGEARAGGIDLRGCWWDTPFDPEATSDDALPGLFGRDRAPRAAAEILARAAAPGPT